MPLDCPRSAVIISAAQSISELRQESAILPTITTFLAFGGAVKAVNIIYLGKNYLRGDFVIDTARFRMVRGSVIFAKYLTKF